jgi:hypothetical protein
MRDRYPGIEAAAAQAARVTAGVEPVPGAPRAQSADLWKALAREALKAVQDVINGPIRARSLASDVSVEATITRAGVVKIAIRIEADDVDRVLSEVEPDYVDDYADAVGERVAMLLAEVITGDFASEDGET